MFVSFVKRLMGVDDESVETNQRFKKNLTTIDTRQRELSLAGVEIERILNSVERKKMEFELSRTLSSVSGEHYLELPSVPPETEKADDGRRKS